MPKKQVQNVANSGKSLCHFFNTAKGCSNDKCSYFHPHKLCQRYPNCPNGRRCTYSHWNKDVNPRTQEATNDEDYEPQIYYDTLSSDVLASVSSYERLPVHERIGSSMPYQSYGKYEHSTHHTRKETIAKLLHDEREDIKEHYQRKIQEMSNNYYDVVREKRQIIKEKTKLLDEIERLRGYYDEKRRDLQKTQYELQLTTKDGSALKCKFDTLKGEYNHLFEDKSDLEKENSELQKQLLETQEQLLETQEQLKTKKMEISLLEQEKQDTSIVSSSAKRNVVQANANVYVKDEDAIVTQPVSKKAKTPKYVERRAIIINNDNMPHTPETSTKNKKYSDSASKNEILFYEMVNPSFQDIPHIKQEILDILVDGKYKTMYDLVYNRVKITRTIAARFGCARGRMRFYYYVDKWCSIHKK